MKFSSAHPSKYLKAADLNDQEISAVMSHVDMEDVGDSDKKPVLYFKNKTKGLVLNKTNGRTISKSYGDETENWRDKPVILYPAMVDFRGDMVEAIRIRIPRQMPASGLPEKQRVYSDKDMPSEVNPPPSDDTPF